MKKSLLILLILASFASCKKVSDTPIHNYACKLETTTEYTDTLRKGVYSVSSDFSNYDTLQSVTHTYEAEYIANNTQAGFTIIYQHSDTIKAVTTNEICIQL